MAIDKTKVQYWHSLSMYRLSIEKDSYLLCLIILSPRRDTNWLLTHYVYTYI